MWSWETLEPKGQPEHQPSCVLEGTARGRPVEKLGGQDGEGRTGGWDKAGEPGLQRQRTPPDT